jgi:hypothetical protein
MIEVCMKFVPLLELPLYIYTGLFLCRNAPQAWDYSNSIWKNG